MMIWITVITKFIQIAKIMNAITVIAMKKKHQRRQQQNKQKQTVQTNQITNRLKI